MLEETQPQPFLPRVGMIWFFVIVTLLAVALAIVRANDQGRALQAALVFTSIFVVLFGIFSAACFLIAYALGAMERAVVEKDEAPASPFSDGTLPPQIIPPRPDAVSR